jgi:hypothetical protein
MKGGFCLRPRNLQGRVGEKEGDEERREAENFCFCRRRREKVVS